MKRNADSIVNKSNYNCSLPKWLTEQGKQKRKEVLFESKRKTIENEQRGKDYSPGRSG
ncbi:hypothetical protein [Lactonifactor longoviformis]|uniref:hypothetical protein n=1 Tax=Lactonifactor longoviformis TaxID=341220 RepID=UPI001A9A45B3|nr:hypothetical protein [Lactonifactor longoviformis]